MASTERLIFAAWHNRLAMSFAVYERYISCRYPGHQVAALVSASRDGGLLTKILEDFQILAIRGSSSRRGAQALREIVSAAKAGYDIAITPDGPRGPCYRVQGGVIAAAQLAGLVIIPVRIRYSFKKQLGSWDKFQIPMPFSRCDVVFDEAIRVPKNADELGREVIRKSLEQQLQSQTF